MLEVALRGHARVAVAGVAIGAGVPVAEPRLGHTWERAAHHDAPRRDGLRGASDPLELFERRSVGALPLMAVRAAEPVAKHRSRAALDRARLADRLGAQRAGAVTHPPVDLRLAVGAPHLHVR